VLDLVGAGLTKSRTLVHRVFGSAVMAGAHAVQFAAGLGLVTGAGVVAAFGKFLAAGALLLMGVLCLLRLKRGRISEKTEP
jgi:hypothetical protein